MAARVAAVTGATGFLGRHLVRALANDGWTVRILTRRDPVHDDWRGLEPQVVLGDLADPAALVRLCAGAKVVIHGAGLIKARSSKAFDAVNSGGAHAVAQAARDIAPEAHVVLISTLAAREPQLSHYAASKRAGEQAAESVLGPRLSIVRPPAVYGPGDTETLALFKAAAKSPFLPVFDPAARIAVIHVADAARQIAELAAGPPGIRVSLSDDRPEGY
ncbi:MAG: epimerase, partial [Caulobacteraceae bacterium]|nr:epimerase [Caulobacteraceae bacterium]